MRGSIPILALALALVACVSPAPLSAQLGVEAEIDELLARTNVDSVAAALRSQFTAQVAQLVPDLTDEQRGIVEAAVAQSFDATRVRADLAAVLAASDGAGHVTAILGAHRGGALAELERVAASYRPAQSLQEFVAGLSTTPLPRERAQLVVALLEARGAGDTSLNTEEAVARAARELVVGLGGRLEPFEPLSDAEFDAQYRERIRTQTVAFLHRYAPASDELIRRATAELSSDAGRWYVEGFMGALAAAAVAGGRRVAELTRTEPEPAPAAAATVPQVDPSLPCRAVACGLHTEWPGRPPAYNQAFGNAEDLEQRVLERLLATGFSVARGRASGITIVLRPRTIMALCDFMSGTDNRGCPAIGQVNVEFVGGTPGVQTPPSLTALNRCGDPKLMMAVDGLGHYVAAAVALTLTTPPGERRQIPRAPC